MRRSNESYELIEREITDTLKTDLII